MTVYVVVEMFQGLLDEVKVFQSEKSAEEAEQKWLKDNGIQDESARKCKAKEGTELSVIICKVRD